MQGMCDVDPTIPFDILLGTAIAHLLATGEPMSEAKTAQLADVLVRGLRPTTEPEGEPGATERECEPGASEPNSAHSSLEPEAARPRRRRSDALGVN